MRQFKMKSDKETYQLQSSCIIIMSNVETPMSQLAALKYIASDVVVINLPV